MVNCNPETVSTDYDTSDRLYFEPLTLEHVLNIYDTEKPDGVIVQFGGQTPLTLALPLKRQGVPIIGTDPENIDLAEDRKLFGKLLDDLGIPSPANGTATSVEEACAVARRIGYPVLVRPSYVLGGRAMVIAYDEEIDPAVHARGGQLLAGPAGADRPLPRRRHRSGRGRAGRWRERTDRRHHGAHRRGGRAFGRQLLRAAAAIASATTTCDTIEEYTVRLAQGAERDRTDERAVRHQERQGVRAGSESARLAHRAVCQQGDGRAAAEDCGRPDARQEAARLTRTHRRAASGVLPVPQDFVKSPVFPFNKFPGVDPALGPEMRSTGEVMGVGENFGEAFAKAQISAGTPLPRKGHGVHQRERSPQGGSGGSGAAVRRARLSTRSNT